MAVGLDHSRPTKDDRRACAAFKWRLLRPGCECLVPTLGQVRVGRRLNPAVIRNERDERVLSESLRVEVIEQRTDRLVEPFAHRVVPSNFDRTTSRPILVK